MACNCGCNSTSNFNSNFNSRFDNSNRRGCRCLAHDVRSLMDDLQDAFDELEETGCIRSNFENCCGCPRHNRCCR